MDKLIRCCFDEFQKIKREVCSDFIDLKLKQKKGVAQLKITCRAHQSLVKLTIKANYSKEAVANDLKEFESTLPQYLTNPI